MDPQSPPPLTTVRRNPPRRAKQTPSTTNALDFSTSSAATTITPFPMNEILAKPVKDASEPENLKVFLRIRPLEIRPKPAKNLKTKPSKLVRGKSTSEKNSKSGTNNVCLVVNDSTSVTLSAPSSAFENSNKRSKSELYDGFSFVFPPDSAQEDVFEKAMRPLVADFIGGKSALLAAMGPTGSGKTHTMFGTAREPGIVPLALRRIFDHEMEREDRHMSRSYYLSMFEIHSERGKGEKIYDLSCDGDDLTFQQSTIKGLQETKISDANAAESLVARCLLKRATAATNANSQSSRSQCIINIRCAVDDSKKNISLYSPVLTIADLAGAEKERKTGNQGGRLLESNFINNTSMVFGLCLRSLLEHQKHPKKSFEKHFKNSLLTRYLKEYLEGKKRMTLILTVKPGELDYLDTSFLLRQASPYMKIKFNNVEEVPNSHRHKRNTTSLLIGEDYKRRKVSECEVEVAGLEEIDANMPSGLRKDELVDDEVRSVKYISPKSVMASDVGEKLKSELEVELATLKRNGEVMRKFSKALWNVLKQYKDKLEKSENKVESLKEALKKETHQVSKLKDELQEIKSGCSCRKILTDEICVTKAVPSVPTPKSPGISTLNVNESEVVGLKGILTGDGKSIHHTREQSSPAFTMHKNSALDIVHSSFPSGSLEKQNYSQFIEILPEEDNACGHLDRESNSTAHVPFELDLAAEDRLLVEKHISPEEEKEKEEIFHERKYVPEDVEEAFDGLEGSSKNGSLIGVPLVHSVDHSDFHDEADSGIPRKRDSDKNSIKKAECFQELVHKTEDLEGAGNGLHKSSENKSLIGVPSSPLVHSTFSEEHEADITTIQSKATEKKERLQEVKPEDGEETVVGLKEYSDNEKLIEVSLFPSDSQVPGKKELDKEAPAIIQLDLDVSCNEGDKENIKDTPSTKSVKAAKPKRKLLPASSLLLKEYSSIDMEENRSKASVVGRGRSHGSVSLVRLLTKKK